MLLKTAAEVEVAALPYICFKKDPNIKIAPAGVSEEITLLVLGSTYPKSNGVSQSEDESHIVAAGKSERHRALKILWLSERRKYVSSNMQGQPKTLGYHQLSPRFTGSFCLGSCGFWCNHS